MKIHPMNWLTTNRYRALVLAMAITPLPTLNAGPNITFDSAPYMEGQLYASKPTAVEGEPVTIHIAPRVPEEAEITTVRGTLTIRDRHGETLRTNSFTLSGEADFTTSVEWTPEKNGMYSCHVVLQPLASDEKAGRTEAELTLPVGIEERPAHFVWYKTGSSGWDFLRWPTLFTNVHEDWLAPLEKRGIKRLKWRTGPMHIRMPEDRAEWPERVDNIVSEWADFNEMQDGYDGFALDEFGGFAGTEKYDKTDAFLREMNRRRDALHEGGIVASWAGGGMPLKWASLHRQTADFVLLELYILGYFPPTTATEDIYAMIDNRVNVMRARDMFVPSWGGGATTLIGLDSNMRHGQGHYHPGEIENVFRYLRRVAPEMRGLAVYHASGGKGEAFEKMRDRNRRLFDDLFFKYFIKPVVTLQRNSLWIEDGEVVLALSNIGIMDSGEITVEIRDGANVIGTKTVPSVPAGYSRHTNRALVRIPWQPGDGHHKLKARITESGFGTVLDPGVERETFVNDAPPESAGNAPNR